MVMAPSSFSLQRTIVCRALVSGSTTATTTTTITSRYIKARDTRSGLWLNSGGRGSSNRVSLLHGSSSRRRIDAPPVLATSESEAKITFVEELADGSIFFSFGGSPPIQSMKKTSQPRAEHHMALDAPPHSTSVHQPHSISQSQKRSPIRASAVRKKGRAGHRIEEATKTMPIQEKLQEAVGTTTVKSDHPSRLPSAFSKRSPIPSKKEHTLFTSPEIVPQVSPAPLLKDHGASSTNAYHYRVDPIKDSPLSPALQEIVGTGLEFLMQDGDSDTEFKTETHSLTDGEKRSENVKVSVSVKHFGTHISSENGSVTNDLSSYKLPELRSLAKSRGLKGYSKLKKGQLLDLLNASES
ncbi:unnamed protein product [Sphagnum jensenii]|uniref:Rho termination factor-like N-terminal domain-containing protein n=1 Tax=Sphagnum jensenii TaxID=128206 RepID=A0ABP0X8C9_9BRYO